jgi:8-oxo-dGTP pyrophosphatase MutT (NUDIX family)
MTLARQGNMVCFDEGDSRFQLRAAGIAIRERHLLVHRATVEAFWSLPGGRVERDESAADTLRREMMEELQRTVAVGPLLHVIESFFTLGPRRYHELGLYHRMEVPADFPFSIDGEIIHRIRDGDSDLEFKWVSLDRPSLDAVRLKPASLRDALLHGSGPAVHFIDREPTPLPMLGTGP